MSLWGKEADGRELGPGTCHRCDPAVNRAPSFALTPRASLGLPCAPQWCLLWPGLLTPQARLCAPGSACRGSRRLGLPRMGGTWNMSSKCQRADTRAWAVSRERQRLPAGVNDSCVHLSHEKSRGVEVRLRRPSGHHLDGAPPTGRPASRLELRAEAALRRVLEVCTVAP